MTWMPKTGKTDAGAPLGANKRAFAPEAAPTGPRGTNRRHFHGSALRKGCHSLSGQIYLVTTVTHGRERLFEDFSNARAVVHSLQRASEQQSAQTLAYVVMPDHLHWLLSLGTEHDLSTVVGRVKGESARRINLLRKHCGDPVWQHGFHDHALRAEDDIRNMAQYLVANPPASRACEPDRRLPLVGCGMDLIHRYMAGASAVGAPSGANGQRAFAAKAAPTI